MIGEPTSRNIACLDAKDYWVTCCEWDSGLGYGKSFEIGIRRKSDGEFWLMQSDWREDTVVKVGGAVVILLNNHYTPHEIKEVFP
jgi:hypothetical protein